MKLHVEISAHFEDPPGKVWKALTRSEALADWLMPNDFVAEVGRRFTFEPDHQTPWEGNVRCEVLELTPPRRMIWSWQTTGMDRPSRVELELVPKGGGTDLVLRHTGDAARHVTEGLDGGWPRMLDRLRSTARKGSP